MTASVEEPAVAVSSSFVPVGDDVFDGGVHVLDRPPSSEDETHHEGAVLGDEENDLVDEDYFRSDDYEDQDTGDDDVVDDDSEFEDDDLVPRKFVNNAVLQAGPGTFLGQPAQAATVQSTVCFMSIATNSAPPCPCHHKGGGGEIIVDYRYTRFLRTQNGGSDGDGDGDGIDGVDMHGPGPKQARLRFVLGSPLASDSESDPVTTTTLSSSLRFAGAVLASLVYPGRFTSQLQALWSAAVPVRVPARTTFLLVTVDAGILQPGDFTPARMRRMCAAMQDLAAEALDTMPAFDVAAELRLPAILRSEDEVRPAKRRRVTGEECPICLDVLEEGGGLPAAWPLCSHIFHAGCLEQTLLSGYKECPLCKSELALDNAS